MKASFLRISGTRNELRIVATTTRSALPGQVGVLLDDLATPPAVSIAARADFENACAWTVSGFVSSPLPRILTGTSRRVARPAAFSASTSTAAPESKRFSRSTRLTGWVCVRNVSNGIDIFLFGPRSLRIRMWIGVWPPSNRARSLAPAREP